MENFSAFFPCFCINGIDRWKSLHAIGAIACKLFHLLQLLEEDKATMKGNEGIVPVAVVIWIAIGSLIAGAGISYLVFGKSIVASVGLGLILGIIIAPSLMSIVYKWLNRYEKK